MEQDETAPGHENEISNPPSKTNTEKTHHSGKKHLKEYLQEGFMIFVAVMIGFFAENLRETLTNREKEKQYMRSYLRDLKDDSSKLRMAIEGNAYKARMLDSLMVLSRKDISQLSNRLGFYRYCKLFVGYYAEFKNSDATFIQLTNADGLRLIKRGHTADSIAKYASLLKDVYASEGLYASGVSAAVNASHEIIDNSLLYDSSYYNHGEFTNKFIPFISNDPQKMKVLLNKINFEIDVTRNYSRDLEYLQPFLLGCIRYIENEYQDE